MSCIYKGEIIETELSKNAMGGTELLRNALVEKVNPDLLSNVAIHCSRPRQLYDDVKNVLWCHDLPGDPEVQHLKDGGWDRYDAIVFVSNWQMQMYHTLLGVPYSKSIVIPNAINPIYPVWSMYDPSVMDLDFSTIRLVYTSTPHRGLNILYPVFEKLAETFDNVELDVFSSFKLYGWESRDQQFLELFDQLKAHPKIRYHGSQPNEVVRDTIKDCHVFAYPSIWQETSCLCLIEALSAGMYCVHPNLAALPETAHGHSVMYQYNENLQEHAQAFFQQLYSLVSLLKFADSNQKRNILEKMTIQKMHIDALYDWQARVPTWERFLRNFA